MKISKKSRKNIIDFYTIERIYWTHKLNDADFLSRIFDLDNLPSHDPRFGNMRDDVMQHTAYNDDWENDWVFYDNRLNLLTGSDEVFLNFLCETIHPILRRPKDEVDKLLIVYNEQLIKDGYEIVQTDTLHGLPIFSARPRAVGSNHHLIQSESLKIQLNSNYIDTQIKRMQGSIDSDPELAIGTAKEFVETVCRTVLEEKQIAFDEKLDFPKLVRLTLKQLSLTAEDIPDHAKAAETIRILLQNLATISNGLAELRNPYGTGHGKNARVKGLEPRHARLAVGAATTLAIFMFDTYSKDKSSTS